jgi:hypothetical protein
MPTGGYGLIKAPIRSPASSMPPPSTIAMRFPSAQQVTVTDVSPLAGGRTATPDHLTGRSWRRSGDSVAAASMQPPTRSPPRSLTRVGDLQASYAGDVAVIDTLEW